MARIRNIKPEFFDDEELARVNFPARLLFAGLWTQADREGRLEDRPERLRARLFPYDEIIQAAQVEEMLTELALHQFIRRYRVKGQRLIAIPSFSKHQYISKREPASDLPDESQADPAEVETSPSPVSAQSQTGLSDIGHRTRDIGQGTCVPREARTHTDQGGGSLVDMRAHRAHASCGRVCVPAFLHAEFRTLIGGNESEADAALRAHYRRWWEALPEGQVVTESIPWLRARFAETYAAKAAPVRPDKTSSRKAAELAFINRRRES